jgi:hypothetical protein
MSFDIDYVGRRKTMAKIKINDFSEAFAVSIDAAPAKVRKEWRERLASLLGRKKKVALPVWRSRHIVSRAWIFYRHGNRVYVHDKVFLRGFDERTGRLPKRETISDNGRRISEWSIRRSAIATFLKEKPNQALEPTTTAVTDRAGARSAPAAVVAHL